MIYDGLTTYAVVHELNNTILNGKVDKIFVPNKNEVVIGIYNTSINYALNISIHPVNARLHLTTYSKPNPSTSPAFCMVLRKHLMGFRIKSIKNEDLDRLVEIVFEGHDEFHDLVEKKLIIEIMGKHSNVILINSNGVIFDSLKHVDNSISSYREVLPLRPYIYPKKKSFVEYANGKYDDLDKQIKDIDENRMLGINFFIDDFYYNKEQEEVFCSLKNNLLKQVKDAQKKQNKTSENINKKLKESENMGKYKTYGELILSNLHILKTGMKDIILENYCDNNSLTTISLDENLSPSKNANKYFSKYTKLKNTKDVVLLQKEEIEKELEYINSIIFEIENSETIEELQEIQNEISGSAKNNNKDNQVLKPLQFDGFLVFIGKNNKQNDEIRKNAHNNDIWFHVKDSSGAHVILRTENKKVNENTILKCAIIAAKNSRGKNNNKVSVDYTYIKYVKKHPSKKPGMVIYTNQKTIVVNPLTNI